MTFVAMNATFGLLLHEFFELGKQAAVRFFVVRRVLQNDFPVAVNGDAIVWVWQIFRVIQKLRVCLAMRSRVHPGAMPGAPAESAVPSSFATKEMGPSDGSTPSSQNRNRLPRVISGTAWDSGTSRARASLSSCGPCSAGRLRPSHWPALADACRLQSEAVEQRN